MDDKEELGPKIHSRRAPSGMRIFTVCRQADETGVSGEGIIAEGVEWGDGSVSLRWLTPWPKGSIVYWHTMQDFLSVHILPHMSNGTIITFADGEQVVYGTPPKEEVPPEE